MSLTFKLKCIITYIALSVINQMTDYNYINCQADTSFQSVVQKQTLSISTDLATVSRSFQLSDAHCVQANLSFKQIHSNDTSQ